MIKFNANLTMLFTEFDFLERFELASLAGFKGVEYLFPYAYSLTDLRHCLKDHHLHQVLFNLPAGDWAAGERGIACHPDRVTEFQNGVDQAIEYAIGLDCKQCNVLAGIMPEDCSPADALHTFIDNLKYAAPRMQEAGVKLLIEAINTRDIPGFYLNKSDQAMSILDEVKSENLFFQYDIYHMQIMEGDLAMTMQKLLPRIAHIQLADNPGRHEPGSGEINYPFLFDHLQRIGYDGWIGCEYIPQGTTTAGLSWLETLDL